MVGEVAEKVGIDLHEREWGKDGHVDVEHGEKDGDFEAGPLSGKGRIGDTKLLDRVLAEDRRLFGDEPPQEPVTAVAPRVVRRGARVEEEERETAYQSRPAW